MRDTCRINAFPTLGELEREISQKIGALYCSEFGHRASKVDSHLFDDKLIIFSENIITPVEQILATDPSSELLGRVRTFLDFAIKPKVEQLVTEITKVKIDNCIINTIVETNCSIIVIFLKDAPQVRHKSSSRNKPNKNLIRFEQPKTKIENQLSNSNEFKIPLQKD